jgi:hypothetical protein
VCSAVVYELGGVVLGPVRVGLIPPSLDHSRELGVAQGSGLVAQHLVVRATASAVASLRARPNGST